MREERERVKGIAKREWDLGLNKTELKKKVIKETGRRRKAPTEGKRPVRGLGGRIT